MDYVKSQYENKVLPYAPNRYQSRLKALNCPRVRVYGCVKAYLFWEAQAAQPKSDPGSLDPVAAASSRSRYGAPHAADHPSFVNRIYTDGSYITGLESIFAQHVKKTKGPLNLLCLNLADLHRCIFVRRRTWISPCFSREAELLGWKMLLFFSGGFGWLDIDRIIFCR